MLNHIHYCLMIFIADQLTLLPPHCQNQVQSYKYVHSNNIYLGECTKPHSNHNISHTINH